MTYTVKQLADLANITVRTLHYYDQIGLLKPNHKSKNGYRYYEHQDLLILQQILFFRELDFGIKEIINILKTPAYNDKQALNQQKKLLLAKQKRIKQLIKTIDTTLNNQNTMNDQDLYQGLSTQEIEAMKAEAKQRWSKTPQYQQSQKSINKMTKQQMEQIQQEAQNIYQGLTKMIGTDPKSTAVQELIDRHYQHLKHYYQPNLELYRGLAEMYTTDERFKKYFAKFHPTLPQFLHDAMLVYCNTKKLPQNG
ncbi:MerR family transcriptional regulator [Candidatus Gracilibacteria bacterium]|nr:MerR family transcriptional regulator [Candidatus Gracilibacteria bacterium]